MLEAEAALSHSEWTFSEDGVLDILLYAHERTTMPGTSKCKYFDTNFTYFNVEDSLSAVI